MKYSKVVIRKLILGITALSLTTVCLVSTTFAWFAKNANAWTDDFEVELHINEGLQISVDGSSFYDSIEKDQLKRAVALKKFNQANPDNTKKYSELTEEEINEYSKVALSPVSPNENFEFFGFDAMDNQISNMSDVLVNGLYTPINLTQLNKRKSYVEFDLYFRAISSSNDPRDKYNLVFVDTANAETTGLSYIKAEPSTIKLSNSLSVLEAKDTRDNPRVKGLYESGDSITVNPANAMRIATVGDDYTRIYEPNEGYSSAAYNNIPAGNTLNDPNSNPMVTYFNNSHNLGKLYLKDYANRYETINNFEGLETLAEFKKQDNPDRPYNDVKLTFYLWLDGYDGDYIEGVNTNNVHFFLSFTKVGV